MSKKTKSERKAAHRAFKQRTRALIPGKPVILGGFGEAVYAGNARGRDIFVLGYKTDTKEVQEITTIAGKLLEDGGKPIYQILGKPIIRRVELSEHRHDRAAVDYFVNNGGRA